MLRSSLSIFRMANLGRFCEIPHQGALLRLALVPTRPHLAASVFQSTVSISSTCAWISVARKSCNSSEKRRKIGPVCATIGSGKDEAVDGEETIEDVGNDEEEELEDVQYDEDEDWESYSDEYADDGAPEFDTGGLQWAETALQAVQGLLPPGNDLQLYSFKAIPGAKRLLIRLDKMSDKFGSPSLDEIGQFCLQLNAEMEQALGEETAGTIEIEVSSPGAERAVKLPEELARFQDMPMRVQYVSSQGQDVKSQVLSFIDHDASAAMTRWRLANVRVNRAAKGKGRGLNKKEREMVIEIRVEQLLKVNLHVDL